MCGILGGINTDFDAANLSRLDHRGPDQSSLVTDYVSDDIRVALGQTRLNIVDRNDIDLPVRIGDAVILFNGEVYNHLELRAELEGRGFKFATKTDTEVVLASYLQWGAACLTRLNGMFAFSIWDGERFFCARDRLGQKPLFYRFRGKTFEFSSEIKAFDDLQFVSHDLFDLFEFCHGERTLYRDVFALPPSSYLFFNPRKGTLRTETYWDVPHVVDKHVNDPDEAVERFIELLRESVRLRLRADVPAVLFLSGGLDSSLIAALAGVDVAFTCQFDEFSETINEERYARDLAGRLGINLNIVRPNREEFIRDLPQLGYHLEMPTGSFSVFPLYRLAKASHDAGFKLILSGEGSDELFAGYARNEFLLEAGRDISDPKTKNYQSMLRRYDGSDLDRFCRMASRSGLAGAAALKGYLAQLWNEHKSMCANMCYVETKVFLQPLLQMADRMCMAHSIEGRSPFLDHRLVEFAFSLDDAVRYRERRGKWIVAEAARRVLPPGTLLLEREVKHGLPTPVNLWLQGRHSFDRKYWNALLTAECIKTLQQPTSP